MKKYLRKIKEHFHNVIKIKTKPHSIALGFAIGTAIAILPTFGLGVFIGLLIILIFERVSKISLFTALAIWNPLVLASVYGLSYKLGDFLLGESPIEVYGIHFPNEIFNFTKRFLLGNFIIAVFFTAFGYLVIYYLAKKYQKSYKELVE